MIKIKRVRRFKSSDFQEDIDEFEKKHGKDTAYLWKKKKRILKIKKGLEGKDE